MDQSWTSCFIVCVTVQIGADGCVPEHFMPLCNKMTSIYRCYVKFCTYPLRRALPRWPDTVRPRTLSRSSCWPQSWTRTRTQTHLRDRRSRTSAFWKTSSSFRLFLPPNAVPFQWYINHNLWSSLMVSDVPYLLIWNRFFCVSRIWFFWRD